MIQPFLPQTTPFPPEWQEFFTRLYESLFPVFHPLTPNLTGVTGSATGGVVTMGLWFTVSVSIASGNSSGGVLLLPYKCAVATGFTVAVNGVSYPAICPAKSNALPLPDWTGHSAIIYGVGSQ